MHRHVRSHVRAAMLALLGLLVALTGGLVPVTAAQAATPGTGSGVVEPNSDDAHITGQVVGGSTHTLLPGIEVRAYRDVAPAGWTVVAQTVTDANGGYDLGGLASGTYRIGYTDPVGTYLAEFWQDAATVEAATNIVLSEGTAATHRSGTLALAGTVTGKVLGPTGAALTNAEVTAFRLRADGSWWDIARDTRTDATGAYQLEGLAAGTYRIRFGNTYTPHDDHAVEFWGESATVWGGTSIVIPNGAAPLTGVDAQLAPAGAIAGTVSGSAPVTKVWVAAYQNVAGTWRHVWEAPVKADGTYRISALPAGTYRIGFHDQAGALADEYWDDKATIALATDIAVSAGTTTGGRNAVLATPPPTQTPESDTARQLSLILGQVKITGMLEVGETLTLKRLVPRLRNSKVSYKIRWYAGKSAIKGATTRKLLLTRSLRGRLLYMRMKATSAGESSVLKRRVGRVQR